MADLDLFVIGAGSGGVACARRAASHGAKVGIAEGSRVGGTCVIRGCVPKKLMHIGAHMIEAFKAAKAYGWRLGQAPALDFEALCTARNTEIARLNGIYINMLANSGVELFTGWARIAGRAGDGFAVEIGERRVTARRVLVAVGAKPVMLDIPGIELAVSSDEMLENVYPLPRRLAVVGAGYIGVEVASIFQHLGSQVTMVLRGDEPLRGFDHDIRRELTAQLEADGMVIRRKSRPEAIVQRDDCLWLQTSSGPVEADMVLIATGRSAVPRTAGIGLEAVGVRTTDTGAVEVNADYESSVPGIYAVGDCTDHAANGAEHDLTPIAIAEGRAIAESLFNANPRTVNYDAVPTAIFSLPQAATVGLSEEAARAKGRKVRVFRTRFRPMIETITGGQSRIMMKLVVDADDDRVLGAHLVGGDAAEIIQGFAVALTAGATKAQFDATVALHPTAAEEMVTMWQPVSE